MARYRRNGTPIGDYKVYVIKCPRRGKGVVDLRDAVPIVWEVTGYETWEEVEAGVPMEAAMGRFEFKAGLTIAKPGANFSEGDLFYCRIARANLEGADFSYARLDGASLIYCNLRGANLRYANLRFCDLRGSFLSRADFRKADLTGAALSGDQLRTANLEGAKRSTKDDPIPGWTIRNGVLVRP